MIFFGIVYILTSICVLFFKQEIYFDQTRLEDHSAENDLSLFESYKVVWKIVCLKPIHKIILVLFTLRVSTSRTCFYKLFNFILVNYLSDRIRD